MTTVRAEVAQALRRAAAHDGAHTAPPAAVLWPDPDRAWERVIAQVQEAVPVLVLGEHDADAARGPAIWLRAVLACAEEPDPPAVVRLPTRLAPRDARNPWVLYLPGVGRDELQAATGATHPLAPLVELAHRSVWWGQGNGQPWTPQAFLRSKDGLGLDLAHDGETRAAVGEALETLLDRDVTVLRALGGLDAARLRTLLLPDPVRDLLAWIDDPEQVRLRLGAQWTTFVAVCTSTYGVTPGKHTAITAAGLLGRRQGAWAPVWTRYAEAPGLYPHIPAALDKAAPLDTLFGDADDPHPDSWPARNTAEETSLRQSLLGLAGAPSVEEARRQVSALHAEHRARLGTVWDALGRAPLARAVAHLVALGEDTVADRPSALDPMTTWYAAAGHRVDDLALRALAEVSSVPDSTAVRAALGVLYDPWLDDVATAFQAAAAHGYTGATGLPIDPGTCVLFVDALRMDLGHRLTGALAAAGRVAQLSPRLAAFPTVTPTGQPAVAPLTVHLVGGAEFSAADSRARAVAGTVLRGLLASDGVQHLGWADPGDPTGRGWTQTNAIDEYGHTHGHGLAAAVDAELARVVDRIAGLLAAGWARVVVVTDHGWLLPANPARKVELPLHLADGGARKPRVARLGPGQVTAFPTLPWTWDASVRMVSAPGAAAFEVGTLYEHGGLSPQECITPVVTVTAGGASAVEVRVEALKWTGLRCRVDVAPPRSGLTVELRLAPADPSSAIAAARPVVDGEAKALVEDDAHAGAEIHVVVLDEAGAVLAQRRTRVGENP